MKIFKKIFAVSVLSLVLIIAGCNSNKKEEVDENGELVWPYKKTTLILPFDAGGSLDTMMRMLTKELEKELDTQIKIDNRPGAATQVGTTVFMNSKDDGSILFGGTQLYLSSSIILQNAKYDIDDFAMINLEQFDPATITVHKNSKFQTFEELMDYAIENPGKLTYSTVHGGPLHLTGTLLEEKLGTEFKPVFYDGGSEMRNALLGEHVDFMIGNALGDSAIEDNVRVLAVSSEEEMDLWPDALPINDALEKYNVEIPLVGSVRFLATHATFKQENPELFQVLVEAYKKVFYSDEYQQFIKDTNATEVSEYRGPEASDELNKELHEVLKEYEDEMKQ